MSAMRLPRQRSREVPDMDGVALLTIFVLSVFVGYEVVAKVSTILHTPLMSGANAIHGIVLLGGASLIGRLRLEE